MGLKTPWRTPPALPRSHSCERMGRVEKAVRRSANMARKKCVRHESSSTESVPFPPPQFDSSITSTA
jgi:hypothetical protein